MTSTGVILFLMSVLLLARVESKCTVPKSTSGNKIGNLLSPITRSFSVNSVTYNKMDQSVTSVYEAYSTLGNTERHFVRIETNDPDDPGTTTTKCYAGSPIDEYSAVVIDDKTCSRRPRVDCARLTRTINFHKYDYDVTSPRHKYPFGPALLWFEAHDRGYGVHPVFIKKTTTRGIPVNEWKACVSLSGINTNLEIHYFIADDTWTSNNNILDNVIMPVKVTIEGIFDGENVSQAISFSNFKTTVDNGEFVVPQGLGCKQMPVAKNLPATGDSVSFTAELGKKNRYNDHQYIYQKSYAYSSTLRALSTIVGSSYKIQLIEDYNSGTEYDIFRSAERKKICNIRLANTSLTYRRSSQSILLRDPLLLNLTTSYYLGKTYVDNIEVDVFESTHSNYFCYVNGKYYDHIVLTYYYTSKNVHDYGKDVTAQKQVLLRIMINGYNATQGIDRESYVMDITRYEDDLTESSIRYYFDISPCYTEDQRLYAYIQFPRVAGDADFLSTSKSTIEKKIADYLSEEMKIDRLRILESSVYYNGQRLRAYITLLEAPPIFSKFRYIGPKYPVTSDTYEHKYNMDITHCAEECYSQRSKCRAFFSCTTDSRTVCFLTSKTTIKHDTSSNNFKYCKMYSLPDQSRLRSVPLSLKQIMQQLEKIISKKYFSVTFAIGKRDVVYTASSIKKEVFDYPDERPALGYHKVKDGYQIKYGDSFEVKSKSELECVAQCNSMKDCESVSYCHQDKECRGSGEFLSTVKMPSVSKQASCAVFTRPYMSDFNILSNHASIRRADYQKKDVSTQSDCARLCLLHKADWTCRSYEYCSNTKICSIFKSFAATEEKSSHDKQTMRVDQCVLATRAYNSAFKISKETTLKEYRGRMIRSVYEDSCAEECYLDDNCVKFDFCGSQSKSNTNSFCILENPSSKAISMTPTNCTIRRKINSRAGTLISKQTRSKQAFKSAGVSSGGLAGVAIGCLIGAIALTVLGYIGFIEYKKRANPAPDFSIAYSRQDD